MSKFICVPLLLLGLSACADLSPEQDVESDAPVQGDVEIASAEQALKYDPAQPITFDGRPAQFRVVDCPLISMVPADWTALPTSSIPGSPASDEGYFPAVMSFSPGYSGTGLSAGTLYLTNGCPAYAAGCLANAGFNVGSAGVSNGDCRSVNVRFRLAGRLFLLKDELHISLGRDHFTNVIELRFTSARDAFARADTGAWSYLGTIPATVPATVPPTDPYPYAITVDYFPSSHTATVSTDFGPPIALSGVNFGTETGSAVSASYVLKEVVPSPVSRTFVSLLQVSAFGILAN